MKPTILFLALLCLAGCADYKSAEFTERVTKRGAPPGCAILCDDAGHYGVRFSNGSISCTISPTKKEAIDWAWHMEKEFRRPPRPGRPKIIWKERCE